MKKILIILFTVISILLVTAIVTMHLVMRPKTTESIKKEFEEISLSAPDYKGLELKNGKKIHYLIAENKGKPIFFMVHGSPGSGADFLGFFKNEYLRENYEIISVDRLGFGLSDNNVETSIEKQAESIAELIETLDFSHRKMISFSHSYGVPIMVKLSSEHPHWFTMNLYAGGASSAVDEKTFFFNPIIDFSPIKAILPKAVGNSNDEKLAHAKELKKIEDIYATYHLPSVFIHGKKDDLVDFKNQLFLKNLIKSQNVQFIDLEDKGHLFPLMDVDYTVSLIKDNI